MNIYGVTRVKKDSVSQSNTCSVKLLSSVDVNVLDVASRKEVAGSDATMSLIQFCEKGDLEGVKAALQRGEDVNSKDDFGWTGLMGGRNHISVVALLLSTPNIDVNLKDNEGWSALHFAARWKNNETLKLLLNVPSIDVNILDKNGWSAVHKAVDENNFEGLKLLLSHPSLTTLSLNMKGKYGNTPVMLTVRRKTLENLEVLAADPRVDLDTTDEDGWSLEEVAYEDYNWW